MLEKQKRLLPNLATVSVIRFAHRRPGTQTRREASTMRGRVVLRRQQLYNSRATLTYYMKQSKNQIGDGQCSEPSAWSVSHTAESSNPFIKYAPRASRMGVQFST